MAKFSLSIVLLIILACGNRLWAQTHPLTDFVEAPLPKPNTSEREKLYKKGEFEVKLRHGKLKVKRFESKKKSTYIELLGDDGLFIGTDEGEDGGELRFSDDQDNITIIKKGNVRFLFRYNNDVYFIESLAHLGTNKGGLYKVILVDGVYTYKSVVDLEDAPQVMCIVNGDILVASWSNFFRIHNMQKQKIFKDLPGGDLIPNSLVATDAQHVYMGLEGGYIAADITAETYKFYKYKKEL